VFAGPGENFKTEALDKIPFERIRFFVELFLFNKNN